MSQIGAKLCSLGKLTKAGLFAWSLVGIIQLPACSLSGPPPVAYVLGDTPAAATATTDQTTFPVIQIERVRLPDYLDTTEIMRRKEDQLVPSVTGRWGERLSVGVTRAVIASLAAQLPRMIVTAAPSARPPTWRIFMDVDAFEPRADGQVILVAHWTIVAGSSRQVLKVEQASLIESARGNNDGAVVRAMSRAIERLSDQLVASIRQSAGA